MTNRTVEIPADFPVHELRRFVSLHGYVLDTNNGKLKVIPYQQMLDSLRRPSKGNTVVQMKSFRKPPHLASVPTTPTPDLIA